MKEALIIAKIRPFCDERYCDICKNVGCELGEDCFEWEHADEALKLIGGSEMALDRFINNVRTGVAKRFGLKTDAEIDAFFIGMGESAKDNQKELEKRDKMLRDTIAELCEAKRLLKAAMEDIEWLNEHTADGDGGCLIETATDKETCLACPLNVNNSRICGWKHQAEALALIGEEGENDEKNI